MAPEDPDGFDAARRHDVALRMAAVQAMPGREALVASLTPLELAEHDLAAIEAFRIQYQAGLTPFTVTAANDAAMEELVRERREAVDRLRGGG